MEQVIRTFLLLTVYRILYHSGACYIWTHYLRDSCFISCVNSGKGREHRLRFLNILVGFNSPCFFVKMHILIVWKRNEWVLIQLLVKHNIVSCTLAFFVLFCFVFLWFAMTTIRKSGALNFFLLNLFVILKFISNYLVLPRNSCKKISCKRDHTNYGREIRNFTKRSRTILKLFMVTQVSHFSSHLVLWPSKNYYPSSTHHSHLLIPHESGRLPLSFHY